MHGQNHIKEFRKFVL